MLIFIIIGSFLLLGIALVIIGIIKERKVWDTYSCDNGFGYTQLIESEENK